MKTPKTKELFSNKELMELYKSDKSVIVCLRNASFNLGKKEGYSLAQREELEFLESQIAWGLSFAQISERIAKLKGELK